MSSKQEGVTHIINVADIVMPSGKTMREENNAMKHTIPLYTLVEINCRDNPQDHGLRLFVAYHTRDCDGTPLYALTHTADCIGYSPYRPDSTASYVEKVRYAFRAGAYNNGWSEDSLIVIRSGKEVLDSLLSEWTEKDGSIRQGVIGIAETGWRIPEVS